MGTLDLFWQFLTERQNIWVRRTLGHERPWTADPVLDKEFITNVYRELDPGTTYALNTILLNEDLSPVDKMFNIIVFRLMGSRVETNQHIGLLSASRGNASRVRLKLRKIPMEDTKFFGDAYRVASYNEFGSANKAENVAMLIDHIASGMNDLFKACKRAGSVRDLFDVLLTIKGFGEFLANQALTDLLYLGDAGMPMFREFTTDEWAAAGPGAKKGIWHLMRPDVKPGNLLMVMKWLRDHQAEEFERLGLRFAFLVTEDDEPLPLSLMNMQTSLCEFSKYMRVMTSDTGRGTRTYVPSGLEIEPMVTVLDEDEQAALGELRMITTAEPGDHPVEVETEEPTALPLMGGLNLSEPRVVVLNPTGTLALPYAVLMVPLSRAEATQSTS